MTHLLAAAGQPYDLMGDDGAVLMHGVVGHWGRVERSGNAVTAAVDLPDGSLFLVPVTEDVLRSLHAVPVEGMQ